MAMGGIGETMLLNAAIGGTVSAVAGGDPLKGALLGGLTGGMMSGFGGAAAAGTGTVPTGLQASVGAAQAPGVALNNVSAFVPGGGAEGLAALQGTTGAVPDVVSGNLIGPGGGVVNPITSMPDLGAATGVTPAPTMATAPAAGAGGSGQGILGNMKDKFMAMPLEKQLLIGGMGAAGLAGLMQRPNVPGAKEDDSELKKFRYRIGNYSPSTLAGGGIVALMRGGPSDLGSYSDGGRMLKGPGDGMSDNIPGVIGGKRPARLADGEFVVPADVVSHLGNGSTNAGAKQLYAMMARVRAARTGTKKQGKQINPSRMMPA